jgi:hypothetical protein
MSSPCEKTEVVNMIRDDVKEIKGDIKDLLRVKNRMIGFILGTSTLCTLLGNILIFIVKK